MRLANTDRNLLFGILAFQMDFVSRDGLISAMNAWILHKTKSLGQILQEQGALAAEHRALLEPLVDAHIKRHGNDPEKSLAAVSSIGSARDELKQIADPDVQASPAPRTGRSWDRWSIALVVPKYIKQPLPVAAECYSSSPNSPDPLERVFPSFPITNHAPMQA